MRNIVKTVIVYFTFNRCLIITLYFFLFVFSLVSVGITCDEYGGGDTLADFGTNLFDLFNFPVFTVWEWLGISFDSRNNGWIIFWFIVNMMFNCYLFVLFIEIIVKIGLRGIFFFTPSQVNTRKDDIKDLPDSH
jgi:hypothetical protein